MRDAVIINGKAAPISALPPAPDVIGVPREPYHRRGDTIRYEQRYARPFIPYDDRPFPELFYVRTTLYTIERIIGATVIAKQ